MIDNFIFKLTWAGLECNVKQTLKIEIFRMNIKCRRKKYNSYITNVGNCRISPSLRIKIFSWIFQYLLLFETKKLLLLNQKLLTSNMIFYLELEFLALDTLLYFSENRWSSEYNSSNTVTSARLFLIAFI